MRDRDRRRERRRGDISLFECLPDFLSIWSCVCVVECVERKTCADAFCKHATKNAAVCVVVLLWDMGHNFCKTIEFECHSLSCHLLFDHELFQFLQIEKKESHEFFVFVLLGQDVCEEEEESVTFKIP